MLLLGMMFFSRLLFVAYNHANFTNWGLSELIKGMRVDASLIAYSFAPYFIFVIFLGNRRSDKLLKKIFLLLGACLLFLPEIIDLVYFDFVLKRMTKDVFLYVRSGGEFWELLPQFILDFGWIVVLYVIGVYFLISKIDRRRIQVLEGSNFARILVLLAWVLFTVFIGRGGLQRRPLELSYAANGVSSQNAPIVLNSGFSLLSSFFVGGIEEMSYMSMEEMNHHFKHTKVSKSRIEKNNKNVVLLILESFSQEYEQSEDGSCNSR